MRLSVECAFPYLRKRGAVSRKSAFWVCGLIASKIVVYERREKKTIACPRMSVRPRND